MRILVYTTQVRFPGGYENLALSLAESIHDSGDPVTLLCHYPEDLLIDSYDCAPRELPKHFPIRYLDVPLSPSLRDMARAAIRLRNMVREIGIDAIEVSGRGPSLLSVNATLGLGTKVAVGIHDVVQVPSTPHLRRWWWRCLRAAGTPVRVYGVSRAASDAWSELIGLPATATPTIYNSIDASFFAIEQSHRESFRRKLGCRTNETVVLCAGRLMKRKGLDTAVVALEPLLANGRVHLVFAGRPDTEPGDDGTHLEHLRRHIDASVYRNRVHFLGARTDMPEVMASADILIHVPRREAFGLVLAEAMASGLPIIASRVDGIPEVVRGTDTVLVPSDDPVALRSAVLDYLAWPPHQRAECIRKGRERACEFHPHRRLQALLTLFAQMDQAR